jgi:hypothetical protein
MARYDVIAGQAYPNPVGIGASLSAIKPKQWSSPDDAIYFAFLATNDEMEKFADKMRVPASLKPGAKYIRTGDVTDNWFVDKRGAFVDVYNTMKYAVFVYGDNAGKRQQKDGWLSMGWLNMYDEFQKAKSKITAAAQLALNNYVLKQGLGPGDA